MTNAYVFAPILNEKNLASDEQAAERFLAASHWRNRKTREAYKEGVLAGIQHERKGKNAEIEKLLEALRRILQNDRLMNAMTREESQGVLHSIQKYESARGGKYLNCAQAVEANRTQRLKGYGRKGHVTIFEVNSLWKNANSWVEGMFEVIP